jgi:hypothetical protein
MASYQYPPLRFTSVTGMPSWPTRLLLLYPGILDQPLQCKIITIDVVNTSADYEALSYVCGPDVLTGSMSMRCHDTEETPTMPTRCRDGDVPIRLNLLHALKTIRYSKIPRLIWVDAICINQSDLQERGRQVRHMRQIYKYAKRVIVWLGLPDEGKLTAFCNVRDLCEYRRRLQETVPGDCGQNYSNLAGNTIVEEGTYAHLQENPVILASLVELFENEYFRRVWCVQEVVAARKCTAQCGKETMDFCELLPLIKHAHLRAPVLSLSPNPLKMWGFVDSTRKRVGSGSTQGDYSIGPVLHVLTALRELDSTDPRDRIFAALGICDEGLNRTIPKLSSLSGISLLQRGALLVIEWISAARVSRSHNFRKSYALEPDYTKPLMDVYRDFTRFSIQEQPQVLQVLSHLQHTPQTLAEDWPSWVPHYDHNRRASLLMGGMYRAGIKSGTTFCYQAEMQDFPLSLPPREPNVLQLGGLVLESVARTADPIAIPCEHSGPLHAERPWGQLFDTPLFPRSNENYLLHGEKRDFAYFMTLCAGMLGGVMQVASLHPSTLSPEGNQSSFIEKCYEIAKNNLLVWLVAHHGQDPFAYAELMPTNETMHNGTPHTYPMSVFHHNNNRKVYQTASGRLGLGPGAMEPGDHVVILFGGFMPFVLRSKTNGDWTFIGDTYLHDYDVMKGHYVNRWCRSRGPNDRKVFRIA